MPASRARRHGWLANQITRRLVADPHLLLGIGLAGGALLVAAAGADHDTSRLVAISLLFIAAQGIAALAAPHLHPSAVQKTVLLAGR
ncbi:MAG TPA: hypothetical protein VFY18_12110, partial [Candidatus Limnocylindrales bacterium]|nr:hypothetical protein [Candidatus Limnocylindrales bacterium]